MPLIASFLAGALLSLLLPVFMLIALVFWYMAFIRRVPEPTEADRAGAAKANPNPGAGPELGHTARHVD